MQMNIAAYNEHINIKIYKIKQNKTYTYIKDIHIYTHVRTFEHT